MPRSRFELLVLEEAGDPPLCSSADPIRTDDGSLLLAFIVVAIAVQLDRARMRRANLTVIASIPMPAAAQPGKQNDCVLFTRQPPVILHGVVSDFLLNAVPFLDAPSFVPEEEGWQ